MTSRPKSRLEPLSRSPLLISKNVKPEVKAANGPGPIEVGHGLESFDAADSQTPLQAAARAFGERKGCLTVLGVPGSEAEIALRRVKHVAYTRVCTLHARVRAPRVWPVHSMGWTIGQEVGDRIGAVAAERFRCQVPPKRLSARHDAASMNAQATGVYCVL